MRIAAQVPSRLDIRWLPRHRIIMLVLARFAFFCVQVKELQRRGDPNAVIALAGNKADQPKERRQVEAGGWLTPAQTVHEKRVLCLLAHLDTPGRCYLVGSTPAHHLMHHRHVMTVLGAEEAKEYAKENNLIYMDTSAKTNLNVKELFAAIGGLMLWAVMYCTGLMICYAAPHVTPVAEPIRSTLQLGHNRVNLVYAPPSPLQLVNCLEIKKKETQM